jgi:hypothetical protein
MRNAKLRRFLAVTALVPCFLIITAANFGAINTTIGDILSNPDKYDGKMVKVEGKIKLKREKISKNGYPCVRIKLFEFGEEEFNGNWLKKLPIRKKYLTVSNIGKTTAKAGDLVSVIGEYRKEKNEIDASCGSIDRPYNATVIIGPCF